MLRQYHSAAGWWLRHLAVTHSSKDQRWLSAASQTMLRRSQWPSSVQANANAVDGTARCCTQSKVPTECLEVSAQNDVPGRVQPPGRYQRLQDGCQSTLAMSRHFSGDMLEKQKVGQSVPLERLRAHQHKTYKELTSSPRHSRNRTDRCDKGPGYLVLYNIPSTAFPTPLTIGSKLRVTSNPST